MFGWHDPAAVPDPVVPGVTADPEVARRIVQEMGFRGRGRADGAADEPAGAVWKRAREADGDPVVVVRATGEQCDPASGIPGYKMASVRVRSPGGDGGDR